jgi:uncharacterized membrane protein YdcZ (DUF606 family)
MDNILMTLVLLAGAVLPVQAGANAQLSKRFGCPLTATTLQLLVGTAVLLVVARTQRCPRRTHDNSHASHGGMPWAG